MCMYVFWRFHGGKYSSVVKAVIRGRENENVKTQATKFQCNFFNEMGPMEM